jgi:predicted helicase
VDFGKLQRGETQRPNDCGEVQYDKFAEYKESVIELLGRVCTVSVETMRIVREMPER